jgi:hypothetical protein
LIVFPLSRLQNHFPGTVWEVLLQNPQTIDVLLFTGLGVPLKFAEPLQSSQSSQMAFPVSHQAIQNDLGEQVCTVFNSAARHCSDSRAILHAALFAVVRGMTQNGSVHGEAKREFRGGAFSMIKCP